MSLTPVVVSTTSLGGQVFSVNAIRGIDISATVPTDGQALVYNSATNVYEPDTLVVLNSSGSPINVKFGV